MSLSSGNITVSDGYKATYAASWAAFAPATSFFSIQGSATKIVKVLRVGLSSTQTTASTIILELFTDTAFFGGIGVSVAPTGIVPFDSNSPAATATPLVWTTSFAASGSGLGVSKLYFTVPVATAITAAQNELIYDFNTDFNQTMVLNSTGNIFYMRLFAAPPSGSSMSVWVEWTEE